MKLENDYKIQVDNDAITINQFKNEGIDLKHTLADRNAEISNLRYILDVSKGKLKAFSSDFKIHKDDNDYMKIISDKLSSDISVEVDINNGLKRDLDGIIPRIKTLEGDINNHTHKIHELEGENISSRQCQDRLDCDISDTVRKIRDLDAQIKVHDGILKELSIDNNHLESIIHEVSSKLNAETELFTRVHADLDVEARKGDELKRRHKELVDTIEKRRCEYEELYREARDLDEGINDLTSLNNDLEFQAAEISRHVSILSKQNTNLNNELTDILMRDQQVKEELNRRDGLWEKQRINEENLRQSLTDVSRNSKNHSAK